MARRRRRSSRSPSSRVEILGWILLVLIPILGVVTGSYLVFRGRHLVGGVQIVAALVIQWTFVGLVPLLLSVGS
jgi:hypothetical protein